MSALKKLTDREREILQLIGRYQLSSKEAALRAGIGYRRVNEICESAIRKLGVANRREALRLVLAEDDWSDTAPRESGGDSVWVPAGSAMSAGGEVSTGLSNHADRYRRPESSRLFPLSVHAAGHSDDFADVGGSGGSLDRPGFSRQYRAGEGFRDGAVEGIGVPSGDAHPPKHTSRDRASGRSGLLSWVGGGARYAELSPSQRLGAVLLLAVALASFVSWIITASLQTSNVIQTLMPPGLYGIVQKPWINLEMKHEKIRSRD